MPVHVKRTGHIFGEGEFFCACVRMILFLLSVNYFVECVEILVSVMS